MGEKYFVISDRFLLLGAVLGVFLLICGIAFCG